MNLPRVSIFYALIIALWIGVSSSFSLAQAPDQKNVSVAAAADLVYVLDSLNPVFEKANPGAKVLVSTGASGNLCTQIQNGAPFDVFLSANMEYPEQLTKSGAADPSSLKVYAVGRIVLWTASPSTIPIDRGLDVLKDRSLIHKFAIANPAHAPYGKAAKAALEKTGLWNVIQDRLILGENISQTAQFVSTKNADAGIVADSLVMSPKLKGVGKYILVDPNLYPRLDQGMVLTNAGTKNPLARKYLDFLRSAEARPIFDQFGYAPPAGT